MIKILLAVLAWSIMGVLLAQGSYKTYKNNQHRFSFLYPTVWNITPSNDKDFYAICVPSTEKEKEAYDYCFDGIVFYLQFFKSSLDSTLTDQGYYKTGNDYFTNDKTSDHVKTFKIHGRGWTGIYNKNNCGISCKDGEHHTGECDFLYFSDGKKTVCIQTVGRGFDNSVFDEIKNTFKFD